MPRKPLACARCAQPMQRGSKSLPDGHATCRSCRRESPQPCRPRSPGKTCPICGLGQVGKGAKTCSLECGQRLRRTLNPPVGRKPSRVCEVCGAMYVRSYSKQRTCGRDCGWALRMREGKVPQKVEPKPKEPNAPLVARCKQCTTPFTYILRSGRARSYCSKVCMQRSYNLTRTDIDRSPRPCARCGTQFPYIAKRGRTRKFCSRLCQRRANKAGDLGLKNHRKRARHYGVPYEPVNPRYIFERDGWRCGICRKAISKKTKYPDHMSASLDHVVPMSLGGGHVSANLQAAHWICNSLKSDGMTAMGEQLMLIG